MRGRLGALLMVAFWVLQSGPVQARHVVRHYFGGATRLTQYLPTGNPTASGVYPYYGECAAPYWVPLYAHVVIPGVGRFVVLDRGLLGSNQVDIFVWRVTRDIPDWTQGVYWQ